MPENITAEAVYEMSKSEKTFTFILNSLHIRNEKPINKKNLITTLYRISKSRKLVNYLRVSV